MFGVLLISAVVVGFSFAWLQMPPNGELTVKTTPSGATIIVDGLPRGSSPVRLSGLRPGTHQLQAVMPGYKGAVLQVEVFPSQNESLDWMLEPTHSEGLFRQLAALSVPEARIRT
jgi:PEGA domain